MYLSQSQQNWKNPDDRRGLIWMKENGNTDMSENKTAYIDDAG